MGNLQNDNVEYKEVAFEVMKEGRCFKLENQDGFIEKITENDILQYIQYMVEDTVQFVTLTAPKAIASIRFVQAAIANDEIEIQIAVEKEKCHLYCKVCTQDECEKLFLDFFRGEFVANMEEYEPVLFRI